MKNVIVLVLFGCLGGACTQSKNDNTAQLEDRIDDLESQLEQTYKPGFGEMMGNLQIHHAKLWFAGKNKNWELAEFELHEIQETLDGIKQFNSDRSEIQVIGMINPAMDSVNDAIQLKNSMFFERSYQLLTNTCNSCHRATEHAYNVITIPLNPPFSNQSFKPIK